MYYEYSLLSTFSNQNMVVRYIPKLTELTGDINASLLLGQMLYWWEKKQRQPFYKFMTPPNSDHSWYKEGDSWTEELLMTASKFRTALSKIGAKISKGTSKKDAWANNYVVYWTDSNRVTYYEVNENLIRRRLEELDRGKSGNQSQLKNPDPEHPTCENGNYIGNSKKTNDIVSAENANISLHRIPETTNKENLPGASDEPPGCLNYFNNKIEPVGSDFEKSTIDDDYLPDLMYKAFTGATPKEDKETGDYTWRTMEESNHTVHQLQSHDRYTLSQIESVLDYIRCQHPVFTKNRGIYSPRYLRKRPRDSQISHFEILLIEIEANRSRRRAHDAA